MSEKAKRLLKVCAIAVYVICMVILGVFNILFILNQKELSAILVTGICFSAMILFYPWFSYFLLPNLELGKKQVMIDYILYGIGFVLFIFVAINMNSYGICIENQNLAKDALDLVEEYPSQAWTDAFAYYCECENATLNCYQTINALTMGMSIYFLLINPLMNRLITRYYGNKKRAE